MRVQKGKIHFTKKDTWNLDHVLSDIILAGLQKFKETNELWKARNDIQGNASLAVIKDFNRKLTAINREIAQLIKSLK